MLVGLFMKAKKMNSQFEYIIMYGHKLIAMSFINLLLIALLEMKYTAVHTSPL